MYFFRIAIFVVLASAWQIAGAAGATKIAIVDVQSVVLSSEAGKKGMEEVEKHSKYKPVKAKLDNVEAELKTLDEQLKGEGLTWGEEKKKSHREKMNDLARDRQEHAQALSGMRESAFVQMLSAMEPRIAKALEQVMATEGIDLILDSKAAVLKSPNADITAMVIDRLNKLNAQAAEQANTDAEG